MDEPLGTRAMFTHIAEKMGAHSPEQLAPIVMSYVRDAYREGARMALRDYAGLEGEGLDAELWRIEKEISENKTWDIPRSGGIAASTEKVTGAAALDGGDSGTKRNCNAPGCKIPIPSDSKTGLCVKHEVVERMKEGRRVWQPIIEQALRDAKLDACPPVVFRTVVWEYFEKNVPLIPGQVA